MAESWRPNFLVNVAFGGNYVLAGPQKTGAERAKKPYQIRGRQNL
jgi:hypothetical protein